jgi:hypothetical protein
LAMNAFWGTISNNLGEGYYMQTTQHEIFRNARHGTTAQRQTNRG